MTGTSLPEQIVAAIDKGQSILLTGPRGCGKSYCVQKAIDDWVDLSKDLRDFIKLQGNREVGRDFLMESAISFFVYEDKKQGQLKVMPRPSAAPILSFAKMENDFTLRPFIDPEINPKEGNPVSYGKRIVSTAKEPPWEAFRHQITQDKNFRFVLFLDEINRFPDGVLDSLLSLIEEQEIYFEGKPIKVPVTVAMTMNPPGYDATARQLSPPLMARIGRSWKMASPSVDAMSDYIVNSKNNERKIRIDPILARKACLATLCLWGDPEAARGTDYLTVDSLKILQQLMVKDPINLAPAMKTIALHSRFGPDGRAAAEWIRSADAVSGQAAIDIGDLERTALATLSHRIYDNFSQASAPEKTALKEDAIMMIVRTILRYDDIAEEVGVLRILDDATAERLAAFWRGMVGGTPPKPVTVKRVRPVATKRPEELALQIKRWDEGGWAKLPAAPATSGHVAESPALAQEVEADAAPRGYAFLANAVAMGKKREALLAEKVRTDAQTRRFIETWLCWDATEGKNPAQRREHMREHGFLTEEFPQDTDRKLAATPRLFPDELSYFNILQTVNGNVHLTKSLPSVWDHAVRLSGVERFVNLSEADKPETIIPDRNFDVTDELVRKAKRLENLLRPTEKETRQQKEVTLTEKENPEEAKLEVPTRRVHFYITALWIHGLSRMARGNQFEVEPKQFWALVRSLQRRIGQEAQLYLDECNDGLEAHFFSGVVLGVEEQADAVVARIGTWLLDRPIFRERAFLLRFLGILPSELWRLHATLDAK